MSELTGKDKEVYDQAKQVISDFIDNLNQKGCLKKYITNEEDALLSKITERVNSEGHSIFKLESLIISDEQGTFAKDFAKCGFNGVDLMNIYGGLLIHQILDIYELFKKYLLTVLDKTTLSLNGKEPLGTILQRIEQKKIKHRFNECIDLELRNPLGHGWYWFHNQNFYYTIDPTLKRTKSITL